MPTYLVPDVYIEEVSLGVRPIQAVGTSTPGFIGEAPNPAARLNEIVAVNNWSHFAREFAGEEATSTPLSHAVYGFFQNGGGRCYVVNTGRDKPISGKGGLELLEQVDEIAIVAAPGYTDPGSYEAIIAHCEKMRDRVAILDAPAEVEDINQLTQVATVAAPGKKGEVAEETTRPGLRPRQSDDGYATFYFPWLIVRDPFNPMLLATVPPSGHVAGIWARSDAMRGVHKAPANEPVRGALNLSYHLTREEQGVLNQSGVNCIRYFANEGFRVWGARTLAAAGSEWRYLNVRRLAAMIAESIADNTRWIVFEPNDRPLWKAIRRDVSAFLTTLWRSGALMGRTPEEAFFVKCDEETNPAENIDNGIVVTLIGFAPVKPAEFIVFRISQYSDRAETAVQGGM
jgi:phage tail sheath protein FI